MKDQREEIRTEACIVGKIVKSEMKLAGLSERKTRDCRKYKRNRLQKMRKITAKTGGMPEDRPKKGKWREKDNRQQLEKIIKIAIQPIDKGPASPIKNGNERKNKNVASNTFDRICLFLSNIIYTGNTSTHPGFLLSAAYGLSRLLPAVAVHAGQSPRWRGSTSSQR